MTSIEMEIRTRLDVIFSKYTPNAQLTEFKEELVADLIEAYQDFAKTDRSHDEALDDTFDQLGDIDTVLKELSEQKSATKDDTQSDEQEQTTENSKRSFVDISDEGVHIGNLHINSKGVRLGDDIVIDGEHDKVQFGDWLHVDHEGARVGDKYYQFEGDQGHYDFETHTLKEPFWTKAHHNITIPTSDKPFIFDYKDASVSFYTNDKTDLITVDEYFSRDNARYFARISETDDHVLISQGDHPMLFHVKTAIQIGLPQNFYAGRVTTINHSGSLYVNSIALEEFNVSVYSGNFKAQHITAKSGLWRVTSGTIKASDVKFETAEIENKSGSIKLEKTVINDATVSAHSGSIRIDDFVGGGHFKANSGAIRLRLSKLTRDLTLKANSGSIRVTAPNNQDFNFELSAHSGSVSVERSNIHFDQNTGSYKRGFVGTDPEFAIEAQANSGTVKIY